MHLSYILSLSKSSTPKHISPKLGSRPPSLFSYPELNLFGQTSSLKKGQSTMLDKEDRTRMLPKRSSSQKTLQAAMEEEEERATLANRRFLSKDASSVSNPSFRVYYGVASAGSVPFMWESAPGTPKNAISSTALPPLTPPPSYYTGKGGAAKPKFTKSQSSKKLLSSKPASFVQSILPKLRRSHTMPSRSPSPAPPSRESAQAQVQCTRRNRLLASPRSSFSSNSRGDDDDEDGGAAASPTSTLCFRTRHSGGGNGRRLHGLLASVVGGGQGTAASS